MCDIQIYIICILLTFNDISYGICVAFNDIVYGICAAFKDILYGICVTFKYAWLFNTCVIYKYISIYAHVYHLLNYIHR